MVPGDSRGVEQTGAIGYPGPSLYAALVLPNSGCFDSSAGARSNDIGVTQDQFSLFPLRVCLAALFVAGRITLAAKWLISDDGSPRTAAS
jgi:hypothetical protein